MGIGAWIGLVAAAGSAAQAEKAEDRAAEQQQFAQIEESKSKAVQEASNEAKRAAERRRQLREERVRRARIVQASINTGVAESSGELGGIGGLATQLGTNLGVNTGAATAADAITGFQQSAANWLSSARNEMNDSNQWQSTSNMFLNFAVNSAGSTPKKPAPATQYEDNPAFWDEMQRR